MGLIGKIKVITGNSDYRVRDVVDKIGKRWEHSAMKVKSDPKYNGSILKKYLIIHDRYKKLISTNRRTHQKNSRSLLLRLIQEHVDIHRTPCPLKNELVVHLRMGDIVATSVEKSEETINDIVAYIRSHPDIQRVSLLTCFAYQDWCKESEKEYLAKNPHATIPDWGWTREKHEANIACFKALESELRQRIPSIELDAVSSTDTDDDMCYAAMANHFISSLGGFTALLEQLCRMRCRRTSARLWFIRPKILSQLEEKYVPLVTSDKIQCRTKRSPISSENSAYRHKTVQTRLLSTRKPVAATNLEDALFMKRPVAPKVIPPQQEASMMVERNEGIVDEREMLLTEAIHEVVDSVVTNKTNKLINRKTIKVGLVHPKQCITSVAC